MIINTNIIFRLLIILLLIMQNGPEYECNGFYIFKSLFSFIAYLKRFIEEKMLTCRVLHSYSGLLLSNVIN